MLTASGSALLYCNVAAIVTGTGGAEKRKKEESAWLNDCLMTLYLAVDVREQVTDFDVVALCGDDALHAAGGWRRHGRLHFHGRELEERVALAKSVKDVRGSESNCEQDSRKM